MSVVRRLEVPHDHQTIRKVAREAIATIAKRSLSDEQCVVSTGIIDSLQVLELVVILERQLQIDIPRDMVQPEDFDSVEMILDTLERVGL